ncbi:hypothetical protein [Cytophaga hutchinsonii]|uniref:DUF3828 domain-containing protein n=1 Tax=Cytophaga hutchinsonii (strain ATCC 33406 / DSM 1761 / CIP 103989 / NBRC 15051 / NCIMB 9469 / D465) TaxID=269798 RepID=A0A6N4SQX3_CYTH3|nr:hypothetical protein [Cytophaga hutchinsonii]ABG58693.1 hypothetical protein CHU_1422 [Cytophaga hutchinsonii ATCC 33406]SFX59740.1 hypothetical protein SAMN04487930_10686 [Cytophaga hutchinsonii ATCC 33406]
MKNTFITIIFSILTTVFSIHSYAETHTQKDSIETCSVATSFFDWYLNSIKGRSFSAYKPAFIQAPNGTTTLDFSGYISNLKQHHFSDSLLNVEKNAYQPCISNLSKIKYQDFIAYTDLDQFEAINCDFENVYKWLHTQEAPDVTAVKSIRFITQENAVVTIMLGSYISKDKTYSYYSSLLVYMKKINNTWLINGIR